MNTFSLLSPIRSMRTPKFTLLFAIIAIAASTAVLGQQPQLSLADILIGLRSKKVTLPERNKLLTEAVLVRGVTFSLTAEIEKELEVTGADRSLVDSIRKKSTVVKTSATVEPPVEAKPVPIASPAPPDFNFYLNRANASVEKANFDAAVADYGRVLELKPDNVEAMFNRGVAYINKKWFDLAIADLSKVIDLDPKHAGALANRGDAYQKKGDLANAKLDYQKALAADPNIEPAKRNLAAIAEEELRAQKAAEPPPAPPKTEVAPPEFLDIGQITASGVLRLAKPTYPPIALRTNITGKVRVDVTADEEGNITSIKAVDGHAFLRQSSEDAAKRTKLKPVQYNGKPIKVKGYIVYNFSPTGN